MISISPRELSFLAKREVNRSSVDKTLEGMLEEVHRLQQNTCTFLFNSDNRHDI